MSMSPDNYVGIEEKYNEIKDMEQGKVTEKSWKEFLQLRDKAKEILERADVTPQEVSTILTQLNAFRFAYESVEEEQGQTNGTTENPQGHTEAVETGDNSNIAFYLVLLFIIYWGNHIAFTFILLISSYC